MRKIFPLTGQPARRSVAVLIFSEWSSPASRMPRRFWMPHPAGIGHLVCPREEIVKRFIVLALSALIISATAMAAQTRKAVEMNRGQGQVYVSLYRVAPGKHVAFLKWMADRDALDKAIGLPQAQWYAHMEGDSWDYMAVAPVLSDAQQQKEDQAAKAKGMTTGPAASIEFRTMIASHTDTLSAGPMTVSKLYALASGQQQP
jgi:hypothetical protein